MDILILIGVIVWFFSGGLSGSSRNANSSFRKGGENKNDAILDPRARQNVIFEHGFLSGKLGRNHVCALVKEGVEIPSDLSGLVYIKMDESGAWTNAPTKELKGCGYKVDLNALIG